MNTDLDPHGPPPEMPFDLSKILPPEKIIEPGIYFDLDEDRYHSAFGLSYSGIKHLRVSPYDWWVRSPLNPNQAKVLEEDQRGGDAKEIGKAFDARIVCGRDFFYKHYAPDINIADYPKALQTVDQMKEWLEERGAPKTVKTKAAAVERILGLDPAVQIWEMIESGYRKAHADKILISQDLIDRIELAAAMIECHPELSKAFQGGAAQVSIFWVCPKTGILCKCRLDYLKPKVMTDLKTLMPKEGKPLEASMAREIGERKYYIQAAMYLEGAEQIPGFIKSGRVVGDPPAGFLDKLLRNVSKQWLWIFQLKGVAPVAKGRLLPEQSMLLQLGRTECDNAKHLFRACLDRYGSLPWVDPEMIKSLDDTDVPAWSLI